MTDSPTSIDSRAVGQVDVHDDHVGLVDHHAPDCLRHGPCLGNDRQVGTVLHQMGEPVTNQLMVVDDEDT